MFYRSTTAEPCLAAGCGAKGSIYMYSLLYNTPLGGAVGIRQLGSLGCCV
jgi:hypothetical protein